MLVSNAGMLHWEANQAERVRKVVRECVRGEDEEYSLEEGGRFFGEGRTGEATTGDSVVVEEENGLGQREGDVAGIVGVGREAVLEVRESEE